MSPVKVAVRKSRRKHPPGLEPSLPSSEASLAGRPRLRPLGEKADTAKGGFSGVDRILILISGQLVIGQKALCRLTPRPHYAKSETFSPVPAASVFNVQPSHHPEGHPSDLQQLWPLCSQDGPRPQPRPHFSCPLASADPWQEEPPMALGSVRGNCPLVWRSRSSPLAALLRAFPLNERTAHSWWFLEPPAPSPQDACASVMTTPFRLFLDLFSQERLLGVLSN